MYSKLALVGLMVRVIFAGLLPVIATSQALAADSAMAGIKIKLTPVIKGLNQPVQVVSYPRDSSKLVVVEQAGRVLLVDNGVVLDDPPFLDIKDRVSSGYQRGLDSIAFHPNFSSKPLFYLKYNAIKDVLYTLISEFELSKDNIFVANPRSEREMLAVKHAAGKHNVGHIGFGPDKMFYMALGDNGGGDKGEDNGQDVATLHGSILRVDVDLGSRELGEPYLAPVDNPFFHNRKGRSEIWAYGFHDPKRFSFDRETGQLWVGDRGANLFEEINLIEAGGNYGWSVYEGTACLRMRFECLRQAYRMPVHSYPRSEGSAVVGGVVYRGKRHVRLQGVYLYGDAYSGRIWALVYKNGAVESNTLLTDTDLHIASFGEDSEGEIYVVAQEEGQILRLDLAGGK